MANFTTTVTAGFRSITVYNVDASGYPASASGSTVEAVTVYAVTGGSVINTGSSVTLPAGTLISGSNPYYGAWYSGARTFEITDPEPRIIPHPGDDSVFSVQVLPPLEVMKGSLSVEKTNDVIDKMSTGQNYVQIGGATFFGTGTNKRGYENQLMVLAFASGQDADPNASTFGKQTWDSRLLPLANLFMLEPGYNENAQERKYALTPIFNTKYPWGVTYSNSVEGFVRAQMLRGTTAGRPAIVRWTGDNSTTAFPFRTDAPAISSGSGVDIVTKNGTVISGSNVTASAGGIVFAVAPAAADVIMALYEY